MASNSKRKRQVLNIETKLEILNRLAKGDSGAALAQFYNVGKSTISDIKKSRETILNFASKLDSEDGSKKRKTMREANDVALDRALYLWFSQRRSKGDPISGPLLINT
ncbi:UNVERIFIED_CONTAM: Jerky-like protein [Trichonephila clavipes]